MNMQAQQAQQIVGGLDTKEQALYLMAGTNMGTGEIAALLQVSPSLISQYKADPEFMAAVAQRKTTVGIAELKRDERKDALLDALLGKMEQLVPVLYKPEHVLKALQVVDGLERRSKGSAGQSGQLGEGQKVVSVSLPAHIKNAVVQIKLSSSNEIVEVDGRTMVNMGSAQVLEMAQAQAEQRAAERISQAVVALAAKPAEQTKPAELTHAEIMAQF